MIADPATAVIPKSIHDAAVAMDRARRLKLADSFGRALGRLDVVRQMVVAGRSRDEIRQYIDDSLTYLDGTLGNQS